MALDSCVGNLAGKSLNEPGEEFLGELAGGAVEGVVAHFEGALLEFFLAILGQPGEFFGAFGGVVEAAVEDEIAVVVAAEELFEADEFVAVAEGGGNGFGTEGFELEVEVFDVLTPCVKGFGEVGALAPLPAAAGTAVGLDDAFMPGGHGGGFSGELEQDTNAFFNFFAGGVEGLVGRLAFRVLEGADNPGMYFFPHEVANGVVHDGGVAAGGEIAGGVAEFAVEGLVVFFGK